MVFVSPDFFEAMKDGGSASGREIGYAFALPRLIARLGGRPARRAELSRWEAYGVGILVFGISCVFVAHALLPIVRPKFAWWLALLLLPFAIWVAFLLLYYVNSLLAALLRRLGLYSAGTNIPFQHFVIMTLVTLLAARLLLNESVWMRSLGIFWLGLLYLNLLSIVLLKILWKEKPAADDGNARA
jgi:hypothetical protein